MILPFRQVHLDFHTSPLIEDVGSDFDPGAFARTLALARVESVTCFSRCHHGMIYHDTRFEELRHPHLKRDLLAEQIEACHAAGIRVPIYVTVGWDHLQATRHPHWLERDPAGRPVGQDPSQPGFYTKLCLNSPYVDFLSDQVSEVLERFDCDGFFFDIVFQGPCHCPRCLLGMAARGMDPRSERQRLAFAAGVVDGFKRRVSSLVRSRAPAASIFYNAGHIGSEAGRTLDAVTHLEIESLPTAHWGYLHFPITARYAWSLGRPLVGMTAAFHTTWGDLSSFKSTPALEAECFSMLAHGARCSVGDQLHPRGRLDPGAYRQVGEVFGEIERRQPFCEGAVPVTEIGVFHPECFEAADDRVDSSGAGAHLILTAGRHQYALVEGSSDLRRFEVIIIPDKMRIDDRLAGTLGEYLGSGGALIASHQACLEPDRDSFALEQIGARCLGLAEHHPDFMKPGPGLAAGMPRSELVMYDRAMAVEPHPGTEVLADMLGPYFNRHRDHFSGHQHAPACAPAGYPGVIQRGRVIYFAHPVFSLYRRNAAPWVKALVLGALDRLLPEPLVRCDGPGTCQIIVTRQPEQQRTVVHLLHYIPEMKGTEFPIVEEVIPLYDVRLRLRAARPPSRAYLATGEERLPLRFITPYVEITVPIIEGHALVVLED